jgi:hypothetical protein
VISFNYTLPNYIIKNDLYLIIIFNILINNNMDTIMYKNIYPEYGKLISYNLNYKKKFMNNLKKFKQEFIEHQLIKNKYNFNNKKKILYQKNNILSNTINYSNIVYNDNNLRKLIFSYIEYNTFNNIKNIEKILQKIFNKNIHLLFVNNKISNFCDTTSQLINLLHNDVKYLTKAFIDYLNNEKPYFTKNLENIIFRRLNRIISNNIEKNIKLRFIDDNYEFNTKYKFKNKIIHPPYISCGTDLKTFKKLLENYANNINHMFLNLYSRIVKLEYKYDIVIKIEYNIYYNNELKLCKLYI